MENTLTPIKVGIFLFEEVEVLDFAGPFEVFSIAASKDNIKLFEVSTVSETKNMIRARNGLTIQAKYDFKEAPQFDILIIPGGYGAEEIVIHNKPVIDWIGNQKKQVDILASVCTGAFLLAKAGLLDGLEATTHWMDIDRLEREYPKVRVKRETKFVDENTIITAGGISAGINMSFYIIKKLFGKEVAITTAKRMEYNIEL